VTWVKWKLVLVHLEIVLITAQHRCIVWDECAKAPKSFWIHQMELLGDIGQIEARIGPFRDSANLNVRYVHSVHRMYHRLINHFGHT
jgi:hypothetical protein